MPPFEARCALLNALDAHARAYVLESAGRFEAGGAIAAADIQALMDLANAIAASVAIWRTIAGRLDVAADETLDAARAANMVLESVFDAALTPAAWRVLSAALALAMEAH